MDNMTPKQDFDQLQKRVIELAMRIAVLTALMVWCFLIIQPFVIMVIGGGIVAIALYPIFTRVSSVLGNRKKLTAMIFSLTLVCVIVVPAIMLTGSLVEGVQMIVDAGEADEIEVPELPAKVEELPLVGPPIHSYWQQIAENPPAVIREFKPQLKAIGSWLLSLVTGTGFGMVKFLLSFCISGVFLATANTSEQATQALVIRMAGKRGPELTQLTTTTIRSVAIGILAVSLAQTALLTLGFVIAGLPAAGLLALVVLILCVVQIGPSLVSIPAIIYMYSTVDILPATIFTIWTLLMTFIDGLLKPLIFGRGATVPTLVIFLGAIGGMIAYGIIGLFIGAVVLSVGFKLYEAWLNDAANEVASTSLLDSP